MSKKTLSASEFKLKKAALLSKMYTDKKALRPVNVNTLTPSSTFLENSVIGINGVLYRSTQATSNLPVTLTVQNGAFVTHTVNGKLAFVVSDPTINSGWEIFTDASIEYWIESVNALLGSKQDSISDISDIRSNSQNAVKKLDEYTSGNVTYTVTELLQSVADLMSKTLVTQP